MPPTSMNISDCGVMRDPRTQCITLSCTKCTCEVVFMIDDHQGYIVFVNFGKNDGKGQFK